MRPPIGSLAALLCFASFASLAAAAPHAPAVLSQPIAVEVSPRVKLPPVKVQRAAHAERGEHESEEIQAPAAHPRKGKHKLAPKKKRPHEKSTPAGKHVPAGAPFDGPFLDTDPGVAVGKGDVVIAFTGDEITYRHRDGTLLTSKHGESVTPSFFGVLSPVLDVLNEKIVHGQFKLACDPDHPKSSQEYCINEIYDGRVIYDPWRDRFWAIANSRANKAPGNGPLRFPLLAVTITSDPRDGWFTYAALEEYSDWPKLAVFEDYALVGHRASTNLWVFDANLLAKGKNSPLLRRFTQDDFDCDLISVVKQHGTSGHMAIVAGSDSNDDDLYVFGLFNPTAGTPITSPPLLIQGDSLDFDTNIDIIDNSPVFRNGNLYLLWSEGGPLGNSQLHYLRVPIMKDTKKAAFHTSDDPADGFREVILSADPLGHAYAPGDGIADLIDYVKPSMDVNAAGDAVLVWAAGGKKTAKKLDWEIRYTAVYHDEKSARPVSTLAKGNCGPLPSENDNKSSHVDLSTAQSDPKDHTSVWIAHARAESFVDNHGKKQCWFASTVGQVKP